jgi:hypothetical protein
MALAPATVFSVHSRSQAPYPPNQPPAGTNCPPETPICRTADQRPWPLQLAGQRQIQLGWRRQNNSNFSERNFG